LQQAISEYVLSAVGRFRRLGLRDDERSGAVLAKAWLAYAEHQRSNGGKWIGAQPEWTKAFKRLTLPEAFGTRVEEVLADMGGPKTYGLLVSAASVLEDDKPERAIELLQQARPLVPTDNPREATRFYGQLIALLRSQNKAQEAMAVQQEQIQRTGRGQAKLLDVQLQNKDEAGVTTTLAALMQPHAPEAEINAAAAVLNSRWSMEKDLKVAALSEALLNSYLKASRTRTILAELEARWRLGWILLEQGKRAAAKSALDIATLRIDRARLDTNTPFILDNIKALQAKAETGK